jgi:large subunit ribosomal protein L28
MSRTCQVTGKRALVGHKVSHSNIKTKRRTEINMREKRFWLPEEKRWIHLRVSARGLRIIDKVGITAAVKKIRSRGEKI